MSAAKKATETESGGEALIKLKAEATVEFRGLFKVQLLLGEDDVRRVALGQLAEALGLTSRGLRDRVEKTPMLAQGRKLIFLPSRQKVTAIDLRRLPALLLTVTPGHVKESLRDRLLDVQEELALALAAYTFEGVAVSPEFKASAPPSGEFRSVDGDRVGDPVVIDGTTGRPVPTVMRASEAALLDRIASLEARDDAREESQRSFFRELLATVERARSDDRAMLLKLLPAAAPAAPQAGPTFAREICRDLLTYAAMMAGESDRRATKMWRGKAETELRRQLGYSGRGSAWRRLAESLRDEAKRAMEGMLDTARVVQGQRDAAAQTKLNIPH